MVCVSDGEWEVTLRCKIPKQTLSWEKNTEVKPLLRKMHPQIGADKLFINSSPDLENSIGLCPRRAESPHRQTFYRTWNITYRSINPFIMCNFHSCPPSRGCFQLWLTTLPSRHMRVSGASIYLAQAQGPRPSASPLLCSPHQWRWSCHPRGRELGRPFDCLFWPCLEGNSNFFRPWRFTDRPSACLRYWYLKWCTKPQL